MSEWQRDAVRLPWEPTANICIGYVLVYHHVSTRTLKISSLHFNADFQQNKGHTAQGDNVKYKSIIHLKKKKNKRKETANRSVVRQRHKYLKKKKNQANQGISLVFNDA